MFTHRLFPVVVFLLRLHWSGGSEPARLRIEDLGKVPACLIAKRQGVGSRVLDQCIIANALNERIGLFSSAENAARIASEKCDIPVLHWDAF